MEDASHEVSSATPNPCSLPAIATGATRQRNEIAWSSGYWLEKTEALGRAAPKRRMAGASPGKGHFHRKPFLSDQTARLTQHRRLSASIFAYNERTQGVSVTRTSRHERCGRSRGAVTCAGVSPTLDPCPCFCFTTDRHRIDVTSG